MIKVIIFDLWETLGTKNIGISKTLKENFNIGEVDDFMLKYETAIQLKKWNSAEELAVSFLKSFNLEINKNNIKFIVDLLQKGIDNSTLFFGMDNILEDLSKRYGLVVLSNTTYFETVVLEKWGIKSLFKEQVYSWQLGTIKPNFNNFKKVCDLMKIKPKEAIFIDDGIKNIDSANRFGMKGIQFKGVENLKKDLEKYL